MRANQFITEVERLSAYDYEGGKGTLPPVDPRKKLIPLPGGSGFKYQVDTVHTSTVITLVASGVKSDEPIKPHSTHPSVVRQYTVRYKQWQKNPVSDVVIGKLSLYQVRDFPIPNTYSVNVITIDEDYRSRGLAKALYGIAISELQMNLISGDSQTPGGRQNWVSLAKIPGCEVVGLLSIHDYDIPNGKDSGYHPGNVVDNLMSIGCDYIGKKNRKHWFYFPIQLSKTEIAAKIKHNVKVYHDSYKPNGNWETFLLARWVG